MTHEQQLADMREDRDRWRAQAERLAAALERLRVPEVDRLRTQPVAEVADDDTLYGVPAIAEAFGWRRRQVYHLADKHGLPTFKIGRIVCASRLSVKTWMTSRADAAGRH